MLIKGSKQKMGPRIKSINKSAREYEFVAIDTTKQRGPHVLPGTARITSSGTIIRFSNDIADAFLGHRKIWPESEYVLPAIDVAKKLIRFTLVTDAQTPGALRGWFSSASMFCSCRGSLSALGLMPQHSTGVFKATATDGEITVYMGSRMGQAR